MSSIVASIGTSHSVMLAPGHHELWSTRAEQDRTDTGLLDREGNPATYSELEQRAGDRYRNELDADTWQQKWDRAQVAIQRIRDDLTELEPDLLLIIGDDQRELFYESLQPAIAVFMGDTVKMSEGQVPHDVPADRVEKVRGFLSWLGCDGRSHPGDPGAGLHLVKSLVAQGFDVASMNELPGDREFGHAFGWALGPMLTGTKWEKTSIPSVPIMVNTYFPPNQPTSARCYDLGTALAKAVSDLPGERRVAVIGSGGLSHFVVDEEIDRKVMTALAEHDVDALRSIPEDRINSGSSEIRNWLTVGGAAEHLKTRWTEYIPAYRSAAGTGVGLAFGVWS
ncbi:DODA-type extradiol aromatic ring-opening family dioxygenase [Gordonia terrae]